MFKSFIIKLCNLRNAFRVLEILDKSGIDIATIKQDDIPENKYFIFQSKWFISEEEAEDIQNIILFQHNYKKDCFLQKLFFRHISSGYRIMNWKKD